MNSEFRDIPKKVFSYSELKISQKLADEFLRTIDQIKANQISYKPPTMHF